MPLTACPMFTRSFDPRTGIWLISELVDRGRIPATVPLFRYSICPPLFPTRPFVFFHLRIRCPFVGRGPLSARRNAICRVGFIERRRSREKAFSVQDTISFVCSRSESFRDHPCAFSAIHFAVDSPLHAVEQCDGGYCFVSAEWILELLKLGSLTFFHSATGSCWLL